MTDLELLLERAALAVDAATVSGLILEPGGSALADAYALEHRVAERLAAYKAAGGVL